MQTKKTAKADLEKKKSVFFQLGLIVSLTLVFLAFEWTTSKHTRIELPKSKVTIWDTEFVMPPPPPTPAPPPLPKNIHDFRIVKNDVEISDVIKINSEADENDENPDAPKPDIVIKIEEPETDEIFPFVAVEEQPSFSGGEEALFKFIAGNIKYPRMAAETGISGTVHVKFVVEKDGSISQVTAANDIGGGCAEEAVRVIKLMPKWAPGKQCKKPVRVTLHLPIRFTLRD